MPQICVVFPKWYGDSHGPYQHSIVTVSAPYPFRQLVTGFWDTNADFRLRDMALAEMGVAGSRVSERAPVETAGV